MRISDWSSDVCSSDLEDAVLPLFETLGWLEERLSARDWLVGDRLTEADIRLFTTLVRFDPGYHGHFKCNLRRIADYPALHAFTGRMMEVEGVLDTGNLDHITGAYYESPTKNGRE